MHKALPQTLTTNELGAWIADNSIEKKVHEERYPLTEKEIAAYEHDSSIASRELDSLKALLDDFKLTLKEGTQITKQVEIPATKGITVVTANREFADLQLKNGYRVELTQLYGIPYPEKKMIVFFDVEGKEWGNYNYRMNPIQEGKYDKPLLGAIDKAKKDFHDGLAKAGMKVTGVKDNTIEIEVQDKGPKSFIEGQDDSLFDSK